MKLVIKPNKPRDGITYWRIVTVSLASILINSALLLPNDIIMSPTNSLGTSINKSSYGSHLSPSISLMMTCGLLTSSSKPSLLIFSIKIERWSSPLPETTQDSLLGIRSTLKATSFWISLYNLSSILRAVNNLPSCPANGEELVPNVICNVGSSNLIGGSGSTLLNSPIVSPTLISVKPATATISPAEALSISNLFKP